MHPKTENHTSLQKGINFWLTLLYSECVNGQQGTDGWRRRVALSER